jgi:hypothetical protein
MKTWTRTGIATLATSVGAGLVVVGVGAANADNDDRLYAKRDDHANEWVVVADDDDDGGDDDFGLKGTNTGTNTNTGTRGGTNTGTHTNTGTRHSRDHSGRSGDHTSSNRTAVSRDRDHSWGDKSRDWTHDGPGGGTRDFSANMTNDRSRNDTRR